ncbi:MAG: hypothetical protein RR257_07315 [Rikenellaceae bacterium]
MKEAKAMKKISGIKALEILATIGGIGISLLSAFVSKKQTDAMLDEKVSKEFAKRDKKGE